MRQLRARASTLPDTISASTPGLSADLLLAYRAVAQEVVDSGIDYYGLQAARIDLIDATLKSGLVK